MKKYLMFAFMTMLVCMSCNKREKIVTDFVQNRLKCPSTMKVVEITSTPIDASVDFDTMYRVCHIYGEKFEYVDAYVSIDSVGIDSMKIFRYDYPECIRYDVTVDAENSFGAMVRETFTVYLVEDEPMTFEDYYYRVHEHENVVLAGRYTDVVPIKNSILIDSGDWEMKQHI